MFISSFWSGTLEQGFTFSFDNYTNYTDALDQFAQFYGRSIVYARRGDAADVPHRLSARLRHRVQGRAPEEPAAVPGRRPVLHELPAAHDLVEDHPGRRRRRSSGRSSDSGSSRTDFRLLATPIAVIAGHHLQLPAVHDAADLRRAREGRHPAGRGGEGPLRRPVAAAAAAIVGAVVGGGLAAVLGVIFEWTPLDHGRHRRGRRRVHRLVPGLRVVRPDHVPAVAARRVRRVAADVHPGDRRLRERRVPGQPGHAHDRQRHPEQVPDPERLPDRRGPVVHADGRGARRRGDLRPRPRHRRSLDREA